MKSRPTSLTIVGWLLIVTGALGLIWVPASWNNSLARQMLAESPLPYEFHIGLGIVTNLVTLACGIGILKGKDWARLVYVGWGVVSLLIALFISPAKSMLLIGALLLAVVAFFLFREPANAYFGKRHFGGGGDRAPLP